MAAFTGTRSAAARTAGHRPALFAIAAANALAAWTGAAGLVTGALTLGDELEGRLPLQSPALAGAALAMIVAVPLTSLAWLAWHGDARTDQQTLTAGVLLVGWIGVQVSFLRTFSWFQPAFAALGIALIAVANRRLRRR